jgi:acyl carrier protein
LQSGALVINPVTRKYHQICKCLWQSDAIAAVLSYKGYHSQTRQVTTTLLAVNEPLLFNHGGAFQKCLRKSESIHVLDRTKVEVVDRVALLVNRIMAKQAVLRSVGPDEDLRASGLSSLGLVNLMLSVEAEFDIKIPEREMTPANFRSIARIAELVRRFSPQSATAD